MTTETTESFRWRFLQKHGVGLCCSCPPSHPPQEKRPSDLNSPFRTSCDYLKSLHCTERFFNRVTVSCIHNFPPSTVWLTVLKYYDGFVMLKTSQFPSESSQWWSTQSLICIASSALAKLPAADWLSRDEEPAPVKTALWSHLHIRGKKPMWWVRSGALFIM